MRRALRAPLLIINLKNYGRTLGTSSAVLARWAEAAAKRHEVCVALAPPAPLLYYLARRTRLPLLAQHVDPVRGERTTGYVTAEALAALGISGSLLNHSEHRLDQESIERAVKLLREQGLAPVLCAADAAEASRLAALRPEFLALEPPELIATGTAVSRARPELISRGVELVRAAAPGTHVLCGAGITGEEDVRAALRLGSEGVLVASGIVLAQDWPATLDKMCRALAEGRPAV